MDRIIRNASEGMILTNGETYAKRLELGTWDNIDNYHEIPIAEYEAMLEKDMEV